MARLRGSGRAWMLASVGGFVDAVGFLTLFGLFTAHQSGNTTAAAVDLGVGHWSEAVRRLVPILAFVAGAVVGMTIDQHGPPGHPSLGPGPARRVLAGEMVLLAALLVAGEVFTDLHALRDGAWEYYMLAVLAATAMGLQAAALRRVGRQRVATAFITGMLVSVSDDIVGARRARRHGRMSDASNASARVRLHGGVWLSYIGGGIVGAVLQDRFELWALLAPIVVLGGLLISEPGLRSEG